MGNTATAGSPGHSPLNDDFRSLEERIEAWEARGRLPRIQPIRRTRSQVIKTRTNRESHSQPLSELRRKNNHKRPDTIYPDMIPEPDYSDSEGDKDRKAHPSHSRRARSTGGTHYNDEGLILPKKPPNPCLESSERQNLHRELLFNQRTGKNVLNQKTELQKVLAKFKDEQKKKAVEEEKQNKRTALEKKLEEQASKIKQYEDENEEKPQKKDDSEFLKVHAKVRSQMIS